MFAKWIELGLKKGFSDIEIYSVRNKSLSIEVYQGKVESLTNSDVTSVKIKGIYDEKLVSASTENLTDESIERLFNRLILNAKALTVKEPAIIFEGSPEYAVVKENDFDFDSIPVEDKVKYLVDFEKAVLACEYVKQVEAASYSESFGETRIVNSKGLNLAKKHNFAYSMAYGIFEKDGDIKTGYEIKLAKSFDEFDAQKDAEATIANGMSKLGGQPLKTGKYPTVFSPKRFGDMLQVFSGLFSGEAAYRQTTALKDKVGEKIAADIFNLWDDGLNENAPFQNAFDDEGVATKVRKVIDGGVFTGFMHNLKTASIFKEEPTGNGFSSGIGAAGLYLEPGEQSFDEMISSIESGFYVTDLVGLHAGVNSTSGDFSLQAGGVYIKNGKLDHAVKMVVLSGNWFELLKNVKGVASDIKFDISGVGSPSVYVGDLTISGEENK
ncbi:TldD/PmbA family protein [Acholeplasma hippikon]|uniref:Peptidase PmbA n=1 Tax=Acholeplasma hippikon TaxID=264636 RepID=A0A449BHS6_9MOLU|nr:TldD/PmbA family protein [Acholeplasma hippikon]VEU82006.1 peptidase PmbA [Acholeplasma hippikon]